MREFIGSLLPLSPLGFWEFSLVPDWGWITRFPWPVDILETSFGFFSDSTVDSPCGITVQRLRMEHRLPQFCSHWVWTLWVMASLTSSPQVSSIFTRSTYGLRKKWKDIKLWKSSRCTQVDCKPAVIHLLFYPLDRNIFSLGLEYFYHWHMHPYTRSNFTYVLQFSPIATYLIVVGWT